MEIYNRIFDNIASKMEALPHVQNAELRAVSVCEAISKASVAAGHGFLRGGRPGDLKFWNGCNWEKIEANILKDLITKCAKSGGYLDVAEGFRFKSDCYNQMLVFDHSCNLQVDESARLEKVIINFSNATLVIDGDGNVEQEPISCKVRPTISLPVAYDPSSKADKFESFLKEVLPDELTRNALLEATANFLIPFTHDLHPNRQKCPVLIGPKDCGKSVYVDVVKAVLGRDNYVAKHLSKMTDPGDHTVSDLAGKAVCICNDSHKKIVNADMFKSMVSGEAPEVDPKYKESIVLDEYAQFLIVCNSFLSVSEPDPAFFKRLLMIPFPESIPEERQNPRLAKEIIDQELSGVANLLVVALVRLLTTDRYAPSESMKVALEEAKRGVSHVSEFIERGGYVKDGQHLVALKTLYEEYSKFCEENRYRDRAASGHALSEILQSSGFVNKMKDHTNYFYISTKNCDNNA